MLYFGWKKLSRKTYFFRNVLFYFCLQCMFNFSRNNFSSDRLPLGLLIKKKKTTCGIVLGNSRFQIHKTNRISRNHFTIYVNFIPPRISTISGKKLQITLGKKKKRAKNNGFRKLVVLSLCAYTFRIVFWESSLASVKSVLSAILAKSALL